MNISEKRQAHELLSFHVRKQWQQISDIDDRLCTYLEHLVFHPEWHNAYEILGAVKFLRLLRTYELDPDTLQDVIYKYEGEWEQTDNGWAHISGGLRHPGTTGPAYYRLQPFQVFVLASMFLLKAWVNTEAEAGTRELLPTEKIMETKT